MSRPPTALRGRKGRGMGSHQNYDGDSVEWYTPPGIFTALGLTFDLDPAAPVGGLDWVPAARHYSIDDDGLTQPWEGRVWLNPPYGPNTERWMRKLAAHGSGVALVFARTETAWWHETIVASDAVCFIAGRLTFLTAAGTPALYNAGAPSALVAYGADCAEALATSGLGMTFGVRSRALDYQATLWEG